MNKELQDYYNEWLLKYGFNPIPVQLVIPTCLFRNCLHLHTRPDGIYYQLKTPEELQND